MKSFIKVIAMICLLNTGAFLPNAKAAVNDLPTEIKKQLNKQSVTLYYPKSVMRYYTRQNFNQAWVKPQTGSGPTWQAMLIIDCVLAYGLAHDDYHPKELTYQKLHNLLDTVGKVSIAEQAKYDILLTDAIITLVNHLHFGKLNPYYTAMQIDEGLNEKLQADAFLGYALTQKDLMWAVENVQPKVKLYTDLQSRMKLLEGTYQNDCYEVPEAEVRKLAINMERLRWAAINEDNYLLVNIPAYELTYQLKDTAYNFKIAVGKSETPTPTLTGMVGYITTAPDAAVMQAVFVNTILPDAIKDVSYLRKNHYAIYNNRGHFVMVNSTNIKEIAKHPEDYYARHSSGRDMAHGNVTFNFTNSYQIYLHDMPRKDFFDKQERAFSGGCIWVANAENLGELLLINDGSKKEIAELKKGINRYQRKKITLKTPVPLHIIYVTCSINDQGVLVYKDVYNLDPPLEKALYSVKRSFTMK